MKRIKKHQGVVGLQINMTLKCKEKGFGHVWEAASDNHPNILVDKMQQPWGSHCTCEEKIPWTGHHPQSNGMAEIEPFIKRQRAEIEYLMQKMR